jgi:hypothetical protein
MTILTATWEGGGVKTRDQKISSPNSARVVEGQKKSRENAKSTVGVHQSIHKPFHQQVPVKNISLNYHHCHLPRYILTSHTKVWTQKRKWILRTWPTRAQISLLTNWLLPKVIQSALYA